MLPSEEAQSSSDGHCETSQVHDPDGHKVRIGMIFFHKSKSLLVK